MTCKLLNNFVVGYMLSLIAGGEACSCSNLMCQNLLIPHWNHYWLGGIEVGQARGKAGTKGGMRGRTAVGIKNEIKKRKN